MVLTQSKLFVLLPIIGLAQIVYAASGNDTTEPLLVTFVQNPSPKAGMPLSLYQDLRKKLSAFEAAAFDESGSVRKAVTPKEVAALFEEIHAHESEIFSALSSPQVLQREMAARVLQFASDRSKAVAALSTALSKDTDASVRLAAASALGTLADANAVDALVAALHDDEEEVRTQCVIALGLLKDERAAPGLLEVLRSDSSPQPRFQAALGIGRIGAGVREQDLLLLLDRERDERVKMALAAALKAITGIAGPSLEPIPDPREFTQQLSALSKNMSEVETKLRADRHDESVQMDQKDIDGKLTDLIHDLEKAQSANMQPQPQPQQQFPREQRLRSLLSGNEQKSSRPQAGQKMSPMSTGENAINAASVKGSHDPWANLPEKERDELLQVFRPEVPLRWRKRLEAYFVSVAAEESARESRLSNVAKPGQPKPSNP